MAGQISSNNPLSDMIKNRQRGRQTGFYSACSANAYVIEAVMERALDTGTYALIEATSNQVNQFGGYTGMLPADFKAFVHQIADKIGLPKERVILGGDHLGPFVWKDEPEETAMEKSKELIRQYIKAGFTKIHIDTSMRLADDDKDAMFTDETIASRAVKLAEAAEREWKCTLSAYPPVYIIGSEVPIPGGQQEEEDQVSVTTPRQFNDTYEAFQCAFEEKGLEEAFQRVIGVVVQPGVEFSDTTVLEYNRSAASELTNALKNYPDIIFEGHSTDYQTRYKLKEMVEDGIAILKVGPALTYALRTGLFALNHIENELLYDTEVILSEFRETLEKTMLLSPGYWRNYYHGNDRETLIKRRYSYSDRCRYYLPEPAVEKSINTLIKNLSGADIPLPVLEQYMPNQYRHYREGKIVLSPEALLKDCIKDYIDDYLYAINA